MPSCVRCRKAGRDCSGYRNQSHDTLPHGAVVERVIPTSSGAVAHNTPVSSALRVGIQTSHEHARLAYLGCMVLCDSICGVQSRSPSIWDKLLPQLCQFVPSVNAAVAAFGAIYENRMHLNATSTHASRLPVQYDLAVRTLRYEISVQPYGAGPLILACMVVTFTELLGSRQYNALAHFHASVMVFLQDLKTRKKIGNGGVSDRGTSLISGNFPGWETPLLEDDMTLFLLKQDTHLASYSGMAPLLPALSLPPLTGRKPRAVQSDNWNRQGFAVLHRSCHFHARAAPYKHVPRSMVPSHLFIESVGLIAELSTILCTASDIIRQSRLSIHSAGSSTEDLEAIGLRCQVAVALILTSTVLTPGQVPYDKHLHYFRQTVEDAETLLRHSTKRHTLIGQFYANHLGVLNPLFVTALKCRDWQCRRQAIALMNHAGQEGPINGRTLAAITSRAVAIEESCLPGTLNLEDFSQSLIPESARVHMVRMAINQVDDFASPTYQKVTFRMYLDEKRMSSEKLFGENDTFWKDWDEMIYFHGERDGMNTDPNMSNMVPPSILEWMCKYKHEDLVHQ